MKYRMAPLPGTFMLTSIIGFIVVAFYTASGRLSATWGFTFVLVFVLMFIASVISITPSFPVERKMGAGAAGAKVAADAKAPAKAGKARKRGSRKR